MVSLIIYAFLFNHSLLFLESASGDGLLHCEINSLASQECLVVGDEQVVMIDDDLL